MTSSLERLGMCSMTDLQVSCAVGPGAGQLLGQPLHLPTCLSMLLPHLRLNLQPGRGFGAILTSLPRHICLFSELKAGTIQVGAERVG